MHDSYLRMVFNTGYYRLRNYTINISLDKSFSIWPDLKVNVYLKNQISDISNDSRLYY